MRKILLIAVLLMGATSMAQAASQSPGRGAAGAGAGAGEHPQEMQEAPVHLDYPHPTLPGSARWAGVTTMVILGMFLAALAVGIAVRINAPEELPETHSHDEHGGSHDQGHGPDHGHGAHH